MFSAHERLFGVFVSELMTEAVPDEWILLKRQFDMLVHDEGVDADSIEKTLDEQIRRRFVELINQAAGGPKWL
jgi:hypothetical protein